MQQNKPPNKHFKDLSAEEKKQYIRTKVAECCKRNQGKWCKQEEIETGKGRGHSLGPMITLNMLLLRKK